VNATTAAAAAAAAGWALLVAQSPPWLLAGAAPLCAAWLALSARAAPPGLAARLRPRWGDPGLALATALALYAGTRAVLWAGCGGLSDVLCAPLASTIAKLPSRGPAAALVLGLLVAPAEELFWRGVVQERLAGRLRRWRAAAALPRLRAAVAILATAALAAAVALATGEPLLALATVPTHAAWGAIAAWRGLAPALVSHATWTVLVATVALP
jgi:membrane protease YdiL (CAAX protease family)